MAVFIATSDIALFVGAVLDICGSYSQLDGEVA